MKKKKLETAASLGIKRGERRTIRRDGRIAFVTLSAGDSNWNCMARHFLDDEFEMELAA